MDRQRIISFVDKLFEDIPNSKLVIEQKEELRSHLEERIADYMARQIPFEDAFRKAKDDLGDVSELTKEFAKKVEPKKDFAKKAEHRKKRGKRRRTGVRAKWNFPHMLTALSPFIYIMMGFILLDWRFWAIGWIIIPVSGIIAEAISRRKLHILTGLAPFVYVGLGILIGGLFWAWGWIIIPMAGIIFKESWRPSVSIEYDDDDKEEKPVIEPELLNDKKN